MISMKKNLNRIFSLLLTIVFAAPLSTLAVTPTGTATMSLTPATATVAVGSSTTMDVRFDTKGLSVLSGEVVISFDPAVLQASVSTEGADFGLVVEKTIDNTAGSIRIVSGAPAPGFNGSNGKIATLTFTGKAAAATSAVTIADTSKLSNLQGDVVTDVLKSVSGASVTVTGGSTGGTDTTPPDITSPSATTIQKTSAKIVWTTNEATTGRVEYGTTTEFGSQMNATASSTNHSLTLSGLTAGTLYAYRIHALDAAGNETISQALTFTTVATTPSNPQNNPSDNNNNGGNNNGGTTNDPDTNQDGTPITAPVTGAGQTVAIVVAIVAGIIAVGLYVYHVKKKTI